jgi:NADH-quinone oxidoreductase subunit C
MNELATALAGRYGARAWHDQRKDLSSVVVDSSKIRDTLRWLRDEAGYRHLSFATAVDNLERNAFTLTYALRNHASSHALIVHCDLDRDRPTVDSIHLLWGQAWTYQREMKEWFGIDFPGSPRVDEEFVLEGWEGPPMMRRDFDGRAYSDETYAERPGRATKDPATHMKEELYPEAAE